MVYLLQLINNKEDDMSGIQTKNLVSKSTLSPSIAPLSTPLSTAWKKHKVEILNRTAFVAGGAVVLFGGMKAGGMGFTAAAMITIAVGLAGAAGYFGTKAIEKQSKQTRPSSTLTQKAGNSATQKASNSMTLEVTPIPSKPWYKTPEAIGAFSAIATVIISAVAYNIMFPGTTPPPPPPGPAPDDKTPNGNMPSGTKQPADGNVPVSTMVTPQDSQLLGLCFPNADDPDFVSYNDISQTYLTKLNTEKNQLLPKAAEAAASMANTPAQVIDPSATGSEGKYTERDSKIGIWQGGALNLSQALTQYNVPVSTMVTPQDSQLLGLCFPNANDSKFVSYNNISQTYLTKLNAEKNQLLPKAAEAAASMANTPAQVIDPSATGSEGKYNVSVSTMVTPQDSQLLGLCFPNANDSKFVSYNNISQTYLTKLNAEKNQLLPKAAEAAASMANTPAQVIDPSATGSEGKYNVSVSTMVTPQDSQLLGLCFPNANDSKFVSYNNISQTYLTKLNAEKNQLLPKAAEAAASMANTPAQVTDPSATGSEGKYNVSVSTMVTPQDSQLLGLCFPNANDSKFVSYNNISQTYLKKLNAEKNQLLPKAAEAAASMANTPAQVTDPSATGSEGKYNVSVSTMVTPQDSQLLGLCFPNANDPDFVSYNNISQTYLKKLNAEKNQLLPKAAEAAASMANIPAQVTDPSATGSEGKYNVPVSTMVTPQDSQLLGLCFPNANDPDFVSYNNISQTYLKKLNAEKNQLLPKAAEAAASMANTPAQVTDPSATGSEGKYKENKASDNLFDNICTGIRIGICGIIYAYRARIGSLKIFTR